MARARRQPQRWAAQGPRLAVLTAAFGVFTLLEAQVEPQYSCPRRDEALGFPKSPQPSLLNCVDYSALACCSAAEDATLLDGVQSWPSGGSDCELKFRTLLCAAHCNPMQGLYATDSVVTVCSSFCEAMYDACPSEQSEYTDASDMCERAVDLGAGVTVAVAETGCYAPCPANCNVDTGRGLCVDGTCVCDERYQGDSCADTRCPNDCSGHGDCDRATGVCACHEGFTFENCSGLTCPGPSEPYVPPAATLEEAAVNPVITEDPREITYCSELGICDHSTGLCDCDPYYAGPDCTALLCPQNCSSHGLCQADGVCDCESGYTLENCSGLSCPNSCSSHGTCNYQFGNCSCDERYFENDCSLRECVDCPANAACNYTSGQCECVGGFMGVNCSMRSCPGAGDCDSHGVCDTSRGVCECFHGFAGDTCSEAVCTPTVAPPNDSAIASYGIVSASLDTCSETAISGESCCDTRGDENAAALLQSLAAVVGACMDLWNAIVCPSFCAPSQGQWVTWHTSDEMVATPVLVAANTSANATFDEDPRLASARPCVGLCCNVHNSSCCAAIQDSIVSVRDKGCSDHLIVYLYTVHCAVEQAALCSNYSQSLYYACADADGFGYSVRHSFGNADDFLRSITPRHLHSDMVKADTGCVPPPIPKGNATELNPWEVCSDLPDWLSSEGTSCADYQEQMLCTSTGGYGVGWPRTWGTFETYARDGIDATVACCTCGGGEFPPAPEPEPEPEPEPDHLWADSGSGSWAAPISPTAIDWGRLMAPTGFQYRTEVVLTSIDVLVITICPWFCSQASTACGFTSVCEASPLAWLHLQESEIDCYAPCPNNCSGRGTCYRPTERRYEAHCTCPDPYYGEDCSRVRCPLDCSGHGSCDNDYGVCTCHHGFEGAGCDVELCPNGCSGGGVCDSESGLCTCNDGRDGLDCASIQCPADCNSAGICDHTVGRCDCIIGRHGADCSQRAPILDSIIPPLGPTQGGTRVTISGQHFDMDTTILCQFFEDDISPATPLNDNAIECLSPSYSTARTASVRIFQANQSSVNTVPFQYYTPPALLSIVPYFGSRSGGTEVHIRAEVLLAGYDMQCVFLTAIDGITTASMVPALQQGNAVLCITPPGTGTASVELSLNGQQYSTSADPLRFKFFEEAVTIAAVASSVVLSVTRELGEELAESESPARLALQTAFAEATAAEFGVEPSRIEITAISFSRRRFLQAASDVVSIEVDFRVACGDECSEVRATIVESSDNTNAGNGALLGGIIEAVSGTAESFGFARALHSSAEDLVLGTPTDDSVVDADAGPPRFTVATRSFCDGGGLSIGRAGELASFAIHARDQFGEISATGLDEFSVTFPGAPVSLAATVVYVGDGIYSASYLPTLSGFVNLSITMLRNPLTGDPSDCAGGRATVLVLPGPASPAHCVFAGPGLAWDVGIEGEASFDQFEATLSVYDQYGNASPLDDPNALQFSLLATELLQGSPTARAMSLESMSHNATDAHNTEFHFRFQPSLYGDYILSVRLSGERIAGSPFGFVVGPARAVEVADASFSQLGDTITVVFDRETNRAGADSVATVDTCLVIFSSETVATFGNQPSCFWRDGFATVITLGAGTSLELSSTLSLRAGTVASVLLNSDTSAGDFVVGLPDRQPAVPMAVIDAPSTVGVCSEFALDASSSSLDDPLGRPLRYSWELIAGRSSYQLRYKLVLASLGMGDAFVNMLKYDLANDQDYIFSVVVTSFLNISSEPALVNIYKSRNDLPLVQIDGPAIVKGQRPQALELHGTVTPSTCYRAMDAGFAWQQTDSHDVIDLGRTDTPTLVVPAESLVAGLEYEFTLRGFMIQDSTLSNSDYVVVTVGYVGVQAVITGGDRSVTRDTDTILDARNSLDMDGLETAFMFSWDCEDASGMPCEAAVMDYLGTRAASLGFVTIPPSILSLGVYIFSVEATKLDRHDTTSVEITVIAGENTPFVTITPVVTANGLISTNEKLVLHGQATLPSNYGVQLLYRWESAQIDLEAPGVALSTSGTPNLVIAPDQLQDGQTYVFQLRAGALDGNEGFAQLEVATNVPPCCGNFAAYPMQIFAMQESVTLATTGWWDEATDLPLKYRFFFLDPDSSLIRVPLTVSSPLISAEVHLPSSDKQIALQVEVADLHGATTLDHFNVTVQRPDAAGVVGGMEGFLLDVVQRQCADAIAGGHYSVVFQLANAVGQLLNSETALHASGRRRRLGVEESLRVNVLEHLIAVSTHTVPTIETAQMQAHALSRISASPSELLPSARLLIFALIEQIAHLSTASGDTDAIRSATAMLRAVSAVLESSMLDAEFDGLPPGTPSEAVWAAALTSLDLVFTGAIQSIVCGEQPITINSVAVTSVVARECNAFGGSMAAQEYVLPIGVGGTAEGFNRVLVTAPRFDSPASADQYVGLAISVIQVNPEGGALSGESIVASPLVHATAFANGAVEVTPQLQQGECFEMSIPTDRNRADGFISVCAAWDPVVEGWSRSSCDTLGTALDQGTNHTVCCCNSVSHYAVLLLPVCPTYPSSAQWCVAVPPPPVPCPANCSSTGRCDTTNGTCFCLDGTIGGNCSSTVVAEVSVDTGPTYTCPGDCSGHGSCGAWVSEDGNTGATDGWTGVCLCDSGYIRTDRGCEAQGVGLLEEEFPWVTVVVPAIFVLMGVAVVAYWLQWQRKRMHIIGTLYEPGDEAKAVAEDLAELEDEDAAWNRLGKISGGGNPKGPRATSAAIANSAGGAALAIADDNRRTTLQPPREKAKREKAKSLSRMPPLLPRDIVPSAIASPTSRQRGGKRFEP